MWGKCCFGAADSLRMCFPGWRRNGSIPPKATPCRTLQQLIQGSWVPRVGRLIAASVFHSIGKTNRQYNPTKRFIIPVMTLEAITVKVLTVADLHQSKTLYEQLEKAVRWHTPDVVAVVGDCLDLDDAGGQELSRAECARR